MEGFTNTFSSMDHYDDGISVNYAMMLRMWSAFDRSMAAFDRKCGLSPRRKKAEPNVRSGETSENSK